MKFPVYTVQSYLWDKRYTQQLIRTLFSLFGVYHLPSGNELQSQGDKQGTGENREQAGACRGTEHIAWECFTAFMVMADKKWPSKKFCLNLWREEIISAVLTPASDWTAYTKYFLCIHWLRKREHRICFSVHYMRTWACNSSWLQVKYTKEHLLLCRVYWHALAAFTTCSASLIPRKKGCI